MKTTMRNINPLAPATLAAFFLLGFRAFADDTVEKLEQQFPFIIQHELGASGFSEGDQITISALRGDRKHLEPGGNYLVEGSYTLASADSADIAFYCTTHGAGGATPVQAAQHIHVSRGSGTFHLYKIGLLDGWLHLSFYPDHSSLHGGVYFGEKGNEKTIMRNSEWFREFTVKSPVNQAVSTGGIGAGENAALMAYLGNPVPPPADIDALYQKEGLANAFTNLCERAGLTITKLAVDDAEFPFLLYGNLEGSHTLPEEMFEKQKGYTYGGSVRGSRPDSTYFAVNIIPSSRFPAGQKQACNRRLMIRLQMLADKAAQNP